MLMCMSEQESSIKQVIGAKPLVCVASDVFQCTFPFNVEAPVDNYVTAHLLCHNSEQRRYKDG